VTLWPWSRLDRFDGEAVVAIAALDEALAALRADQREHSAKLEPLRNELGKLDE
jgi:hypothetical protein